MSSTLQTPLATSYQVYSVIPETENTQVRSIQIRSETIYRLISNIPRTDKTQIVKYYRHEQTASEIAEFLSAIKPDAFNFKVEGAFERVIECIDGSTRLNDCPKGEVDEVSEIIAPNRREFLKLFWHNLKYKKLETQEKARPKSPASDSSLEELSPLSLTKETFSYYPPLQTDSSESEEEGLFMPAVTLPSLEVVKAKTGASTLQNKKLYQVVVITPSTSKEIPQLAGVYEHESTAKKVAMFLKRIFPEELFTCKVEEIAKTEKSIFHKTKIDCDEYIRLLDLQIGCFKKLSSSKITKSTGPVTRKKQRVETQIEYENEPSFYPDNREAFTHTYFEKNRDIILADAYGL